MKKVICILGFLAAVAIPAFAADTTTTAWWYTPDGGWQSSVSVQLTTSAGNLMGNPLTITADWSEAAIYDELKSRVDASGESQSAKNAYTIACKAMAQSLHEKAVNARQDEKIKTLGDTLETFLYADTTQLKYGDDVVVEYERDASTQQTVESIKAARKYVSTGAPVDSGQGAVITQTVKKDMFNDKNITLQADGDGKSYALRGYTALSDDKTAGSDGANGWALAYTDYFIPYSTGKSAALGWYKWNGWDIECFSAGDDVAGGSNDQRLRLRGWTTANNCNESIQHLLTNETATVDRGRHKILTRYDDGKGATIHWVKFDAEAMKMGGETAADGESIEYTKDEGASSEDPKKFRLKGFATAKPAQAADGAVLPFVDATNDDLQWGSIMNFFADSVFKQSSETGKILLNGTSEEGKVKVLAITGNGEDDQHISALTFDNASIDGNPAVGGIVQLHGFDAAPSPYASGDVSFADVLTNTATQITGMSVPVRVPEQGVPAGYVVKYVPMGKITGTPAALVDNKTIEVNETDPQNKFLQLHGAAGEGITLEEGDVYQIDKDGKGKFAKLGAESEDEEVGAENASIESYTDEDGGKYFRLRDWMINREGVPHILGWSEHALKYWTVDGSNGVDVNSGSGNEAIMLSGYLDANEGSIPYAKKDGNGLGWLKGVDGRVPLLHTDGEPTSMAIGSSLETANVSAVPTLNVANFASGGNCNVSLNKMLSDPSETSNRSAHQFMARYSDGGNPSVHWVGIDGVIASALEAGSGITIVSNGTAQVVSHNLVAGAGISLTPSANGTAVTIASATPTAATPVDPHLEEITYLTEIWYDPSAHKIKAKRRTAIVMVAGSVSAEEEFDVVVCTPHSAEIEAESNN